MADGGKWAGGGASILMGAYLSGSNYTLGLRDYGQLQNAMAKLRQNEGVKLKNTAATWAPKQIFGR